ncbi:MAG: preprotein translocase subunit SecE [Candidatus Cloacimonetes bacterium]|nr:preprotein translocase subunit SecE [Candidatus Cloacimonadota bacterium]
MIKKMLKFFKDVRQELKFVTWPSRDDLKEGTIVVVVMSTIVSLFLFAVDSIFSVLMRYILIKG